MSDLAHLLRALAARDGIDAVVLISADGLPISHAARSACDADAMAALAVTLLRSAARLGETASRGTLSRSVFEYEGGLLVITLLADGNVLLVAAAAGTDVGPMLYDLRHQAPALSALL